MSEGDIKKLANKINNYYDKEMLYDHYTIYDIINNFFWEEYTEKDNYYLIGFYGDNEIDWEIHDDLRQAEKRGKDQYHKWLIVKGSVVARDD